METQLMVIELHQGQVQDPRPGRAARWVLVLETSRPPAAGEHVLLWESGPVVEIGRVTWQLDSGEVASIAAPVYCGSMSMEQAEYDLLAHGWVPAEDYLKSRGLLAVVKP